MATASLLSSGNPTPAVASAKSQNKSKKDGKKRASLRFEVELDLVSKNSYTHLSFLEMTQKFASSSTGKGREKKSDDISDPFGDDDDDDVARIAAKFEKKYGPGSMYDVDGYIDKGEGYDENDPFIDNAEAYDELIPANLTTELGGFYINRGELHFKLVENDKVDKLEDEFEKAELLRKLKRKRNKVEDDSDSDDKPKKPNKSKYLNLKTKQPGDISNVVRKIETEIVPVSIVEPKRKQNTNNTAQNNSIINNGIVGGSGGESVSSKATKPKTTKQSSGINRSRQQPTQLPNQIVPKQRKNAKHQNLPVQSSLPSSTQNAVSLVQNLFSSTIQQMISDSLMGNTTTVGASGGGGISSTTTTATPNNNTSSSSVTVNSTHLQLRQSLLKCKTPYEIVNSIPIVKPNITDSNSVVPHEWNRFLVDVFKKTSSSVKNRQTIFELLAKYLGVTCDSLINYSQKITLDPVLVQKYVKPNSGSSNLPAREQSSSSSSSHVSNTTPAASSAAYQSAMLAAANQIHNQKNTSKSANTAAAAMAAAAAMSHAMNLSTNNPSNNQSFSEGLASKLINQTPDNSGVSKATNSGRASTGSINSKTMTTKSNHMLSKMSNLAVLQSLASLASSTNNVPGVTTSSSMVGHVKNAQQQMMLNQRSSPTPPPRGAANHSGSQSTTSSINTNSLLASMNSKAATVNTTSGSGATVGTQQSSSATSGRNSSPDLINLFQIPNLFNNTNLFNHFLSQPTTVASSSSSLPSTSSVPSAVNVPSTGRSTSVLVGKNSSKLIQTNVANSLLSTNPATAVINNSNNSVSKAYHTIHYGTVGPSGAATSLINHHLNASNNRSTIIQGQQSNKSISVSNIVGGQAMPSTPAAAPSPSATLTLSTPSSTTITNSQAYTNK